MRLIGPDELSYVFKEASDLFKLRTEIKEKRIAAKKARTLAAGGIYLETSLRLPQTEGELRDWFLDIEKIAFMQGYLAKWQDEATLLFEGNNRG